jgi:ParB family chromosome partitioning protein
MTTTGVAGKPAEKKEEKVEKRRALGRGLESLLPGPRVVVAPASAGRAVVPVGDRGAADEPRVPHFVRNDKSVPDDRDTSEQHAELRSAGQPRAAVPTLNAETIEIRAVAEMEAAAGAGGTDGPVGDSGGTGEQQVPHRLAPVRNDRTIGSGAVPHEGITIQAMAEEPVARGISLNQIPLDRIDENPFQTRYFFDKESLQELADSIRENGVLQPVVVRPGEEEGRYILVLGERRLQASKLAKKETIPAIVRRVSEQQAAEMTLIENLQREDLNCMEQAEAFRVLSKEFNMTQEEIGKRVGMSRESVSNYMRLLRLPEQVMEYLLHDRLSFSEARELLGLHDEKNIQAAADIVAGKHMSLEEIEDLVAKYNGWPDAQGAAAKPGVGGGARWQDPNVRAAQTELEQLLRVRVRIKDRKGKGKIVIEYATVDDYERVLGMLKGKK